MLSEKSNGLEEILVTNTCAVLTISLDDLIEQSESDFLTSQQFYIAITKCDRACENRACGHMIFAYFFKLPSHTTFYTINLLQCNFQVIVSIYFAL